MDGEFTHYVPYFTVKNGKRFRAACGPYVYRDEIAEMRGGEVHPTCPRCLAYLQQEAETDASMLASFGDGLEPR